MFRIKICGITNVDDAMAAAQAGADAIGLNFFSGSRRCITPEVAKQVAAAVGEKIDRVGVFVNASADEICQTCQATGIRTVQLHGDEPPGFLNSLPDECRIVRARRLDDRGMEAIREDLNACAMATGSRVHAILLDAAVPGEYGGTGRTIDWHDVAGYRETLGPVPLVLAGGLSPENVAEAIRIVRPHAVDVASGVEATPGKKDFRKVRSFVSAAREAFAAASEQD